MEGRWKGDGREGGREGGREDERKMKMLEGGSRTV